MARLASSADRALLPPKPPFRSPPSREECPPPATLRDCSPLPACRAGAAGRGPRLLSAWRCAPRVCQRRQGRDQRAQAVVAEDAPSV
eukprot:6214496-Prymnesium_polylepis.2